MKWASSPGFVEIETTSLYNVKQQPSNKRKAYSKYKNTK